MYILNYAEIYSEKCMLFHIFEIIFILAYENVCCHFIHDLRLTYGHIIIPLTHSNISNHKLLQF